MLKTIRLIVILVLLGATGWLSWKVYNHERQKRAMKEDLIELSKVKFGLFNADEWRTILAGIITKKIEQFNLEITDRKQMREKIRTFLYKIIRDLKEDYYKETSGTLLGRLKGKVTSFTGIFDQIEKNIPTFTERIIDFMNDPENRKQLRQLIINKLNEYTEKTFSDLDYTTHDQILKKYGYSARADAITGMTSTIAEMEARNKPYVFALLGLAGAVCLLVLFSTGITRVEYLLLTLLTVALLATGLSLPMIEIDARIEHISFTMLGEPISFHDQVLYYKSKSILEVVKLMMLQDRADLIVVGVLVFTFSVLFPLSKLLSSVIYLYVPPARKSRAIRFMIFRTGKWSMADVMVIAIFMSYIGFSGIITEQLRQLEGIALNIDILTTNRSSLLSGFFAFTAFAITSLLISHKLQYSFREDIAHP